MVEKRRRTSSFHHSVGFVRLFFGSSMACVAHGVVGGVAYDAYGVAASGCPVRSSSSN